MIGVADISENDSALLVHRLLVVRATWRPKNIKQDNPPQKKEMSVKTIIQYRKQLFQKYGYKMKKYRMTATCELDPEPYWDEVHCSRWSFEKQIEDNISLT